MLATPRAAKEVPFYTSKRTSNLKLRPHLGVSQNLPLVCWMLGQGKTFSPTGRIKHTLNKFKKWPPPEPPPCNLICVTENRDINIRIILIPLY